MTQVIGTIKKIFDTVQVSEKFSKRDLVVTTNDMYPQDIIMQFTQDKCSILDGYKEMDQVDVSVNLRGREWTSPQGEIKYFNTIEAWRIEKLGAKKPSGNIEQNFAEDEISQMQSEEEDDLPF